MKKFEFSWSRFFSAAMCGAMLLFAGCEEENGPEAGLFTIEITDGTEYGDYTITAPEGTTQFYMDIAELGSSYTEEDAISAFLNGISSPENASYYLKEENPYSSSIAAFWAHPMMGPMPLGEGITYMIMVAPIDNPTADAVEYKTYTHGGGSGDVPVYTLGETTADVTISEATATANSLSVTITPGEGSSFFSYWMSEYDWENYTTPEAQMEYVTSGGFSHETEYVESTSGEPETTYYLVVYVFDSNNVGKIYTREASTTGLVESSVTMSVVLDAETVGETSATLEIKPVGGEIVKFSYYVKDEFYMGTEEDLMRDLQLGNYGTPVETLAADNRYLIESLKRFASNSVYVVGFDAEGKPTAVVKVDVDTSGSFNYVNDAKSVSVSKVEYTYDLFWDWNVYPPVVNDVTAMTWVDLATVESFDEFVYTEEDAEGNITMTTTAKSGSYRVTVQWPEGFTPNNVWMTDSVSMGGELTGMPNKAETASIYNKVSELITNGMYDMAIAKQGYLGDVSLCSIQYHEVDWMPVFDSASGPVIYIAFDDAEGNIYPYVTVDLNNYISQN